MQRLEFSGAVRPIYGLLGVKRLTGRGMSKYQEHLLSQHHFFHNKLTFGNVLLELPAVLSLRPMRTTHTDTKPHVPEG